MECWIALMPLAIKMPQIEPGANASAVIGGKCVGSLIEGNQLVGEAWKIVLHQASDGVSRFEREARAGGIILQACVYERDGLVRLESTVWHECRIFAPSGVLAPE